MLIHRSRWWLVILAASAVAAAEWLRQPAAIWPWLAGVVVVAGFLVLRPMPDWRARLALSALVLFALVIAVSQRRLGRIDRKWPDVREQMVSGAFQSLGHDLDEAYQRVTAVVDLASSAAVLNREAAFGRLASAVRGPGAELGVALYEPTGIPFAWAGRFRLAPSFDGDSLQARVSRFYIVLQRRRQLTNGRMAVGSLLLWADPAVPERSGSLADVFLKKTGVNLVFYPAGSAPASVEVFDYGDSTAAGPRSLFLVEPRPPEQGAYQDATLASASRMVGAVLLALFVTSLPVLGSAVPRLGTALLLLLVVLLAPAGETFGLKSFFSPATYFRSMLGPLSASAGALALCSGLVTLGGVTLWRKRIRVRWYGAALGAALLLVAPYGMRELGRGITPPASGVSLGLWLSWQVALLLATAAPIVVAAALFRGDRPVEVTPRAIWIGAAVAGMAAVAGVFVWNPSIGWPPWYTVLWTPALFLVTRPSPRHGAVAGIAIVAGCAAALITWGAVLEGRLDVARKDVSGLGRDPDPLTLRLLERFGEQVRLGPPPTNASELFALWRSSGLGTEDYPAQLGLWSKQGERLVELSLDSLDLGAALLSTLVRNLDSTVVRQTIQLFRVPGMHSVLLQRVAPDAVMTVAVGPRSRLISEDRLGRLLHRQSADPPLYSLSLTLPETAADTAGVRVGWRRNGWRVRGERLLAVPGGMRHVHADVGLRGPTPIFVRGTLVVMLDLGIMALIWVLAELLAGESIRPWSLRRLARSYRARLAVALGLFFLVPAAGFAALGFSRLSDEAGRSRDLLIRQTLRDAVLTAGTLIHGPSEDLAEGLSALSRRIDAELALYSGGALASSSAPVLQDLGIVSPLVPPDAFIQLALEDELEVTQRGLIATPGVRIGYRVVRPGQPGSVGILATPQPALDAALGEQQVDLILILLLATLIGVGGALGGAQAAARALSRPVADLRRAALDLGQGKTVSDPAQAPPLEFEAVFGAFTRMAENVKASQAALEEARRRTATVLANVATGVVALDAAGRVLLANRRAEEMLGAPLVEGDALEQLVGPDWGTLVDTVGRFQHAERGEGSASAEVDVQGRRIRLQLARLETELRGVVVALDDLTDVSHAERVLAWGEMARQVAHEIKNPLTPLRLGIQHLQRVHKDQRADFDRTLQDTSLRILAEIDRLDTIARAFSRFGAPADAVVPLERLDLAVVAREVVQLYTLGEGGTVVRLQAEGPCRGVARRDEVKEVLVNLLENARDSGAGRVLVRVAPGRLMVEDDGAGIAAEQLSRIFEPRFSTTTSGAGLGLPIVKRLVEGWGAEIEVRSEPGRGTVVEIRMADSGTVGRWESGTVGS